MQHFHAVPTYIKKEDKHLLEHPLPAGKTITKVEIQHGDKHDPGYAYVSGSDDSHVYQPAESAEYSKEFAEYQAYQQALVHQETQQNEAYQVQDQGNDYSQYQEQVYQGNEAKDSGFDQEAYTAAIAALSHYQPQAEAPSYHGYYTGQGLSQYQTVEVPDPDEKSERK